MDKYTKPEGSYISFMSNKVKQHGGINLAQGIPGYQPPKELLNILVNITYDNIHQYAPGIGDIKLLEQLVKNYQKYHPFTINNFLVVQGATEAISLLYIYFSGIIKEKFSVLAFDPVYESYNNLPGIFNHNFVCFPLESNTTLNFDKLEKEIVSTNVKLIFVSSPGNPYGKTWSKEELDKIIALSEKHDFYIIFDAVYKELYFNEPPHIPLDNFNERLFYVNSFSKLFSITGWRIGYFIAHEKHMKNIRSIHDYIGLCAPSLLQKAIAEYLEQHQFGKDYVAELRKQLNTSYKLMSNALLKLGFEIPETSGGYFVWAKLPEQYKDGFKFTIDLWEQEKVAVIPGEHFSKNCSDYIRFNIAREMSEVKEGLKRIQHFFE